MCALKKLKFKLKHYNMLLIYKFSLDLRLISGVQIRVEIITNDPLFSVNKNK